MLVAALLCGALAVATGFTVSRDVALHLDQAIERQPTVDPFLDLKPDERKTMGRDTGRPINETIKRFLAISVTIRVEMRLVGFDGLSYRQISVSDSTMRAYLNALGVEMVTAVLQPSLALMPVYPHIQWVVSHDQSRMVNRLDGAIKQEASHYHADQGHEGQEHGSHPIPIRYQTIDDIITQDTSRDPGAHLTIYILNLNSGAGKYAYRYIPGTEDQPDCLGTHYVSPWTSAMTPRYLWWDIAAGPVNYGPGAKQKGHVFEHTMAHPGNIKPEALPHALTPQLMANAWSAVQHLVWPPMQHAQVHFKTHLIIQIIHIHERLSHSSEKFDRALIEHTLQTVVGNHQVVEVHETWLPMASCTLCIEAYTSSLKVRTAREDSSTMLLAQASRVLDPLTLHRLLRRYRDGIFGHAGIAFETGVAEYRVLPVFIWDIKGATADPVLFTEGRQAVAFPDMVMAVSSLSGIYSTSATCGYTQMVADSHDVTRAVLAGILETGWGVANASVYYSMATGVSANHMWALSSTPWGYLSTSLQISASVAHIFPRNMVLAHLNTTAKRMVTLLTGFSRLSRSGKFDVYSYGEQKVPVLTRVNLAVYKLQRIQLLMNQADYWRALLYARSLDHDIAHLDRLAVKVAHSTKRGLTCEAGPTLFSFWWAPTAALASWAVAALLRRKIYAKKLGKMA